MTQLLIENGFLFFATAIAVFLWLMKPAEEDDGPIQTSDRLMADMLQGGEPRNKVVAAFHPWGCGGGGGGH